MFAACRDKQLDALYDSWLGHSRALAMLKDAAKKGRPS